MSKSDKHEEDILKQYIDAARIENAPDGFTEEVMTRIRFETVPDKAFSGRHFRIPVPLVAAITVTALVILSLIVPASNAEPSLLVNLFGYLNIPAIKLNNDLLPAINIPGWISWISVGILFLTLFDRALAGVFHRQKH